MRCGECEGAYEPDAIVAGDLGAACDAGWADDGVGDGSVELGPDDVSGEGSSCDRMCAGGAGLVLIVGRTGSGRSSISGAGAGPTMSGCRVKPVFESASTSVRCMPPRCRTWIDARSERSRIDALDQRFRRTGHDLPRAAGRLEHELTSVRQPRPRLECPLEAIRRRRHRDGLS